MQLIYNEVLNSQDDTERFAYKISEYISLSYLRPGNLKADNLSGNVLFNPCIIALNGDLGSGKTTFVRYLLESFGYEGFVKSPTYSLVEVYELKDVYKPDIKAHFNPVELNNINIYHWDWYRLADSSEVEFLGFSELVSTNSLHLIEWAKLFPEMLDFPHISIEFTFNSDEKNNTDKISNKQQDFVRRCIVHKCKH